jgi:hypothetical protein
MTKPKPLGPTAFYFVYAYFVHLSDDTPECADLIVEARSKEQAIELWRKHFSLRRDEGDLRSVFRLPLLSGEPGVIEWQSMNPKLTETEN